MAIFKDTIMIKDKRFDRAVQATVIAPDDNRQGEGEGQGIPSVAG